MTVGQNSRDLVLVCDDDGALRRLYSRALTSCEVRSSHRIEALLDLVRAATTEGRLFWLILDGDIKIYQNDDERPEGQIGAQTGEEALAQVKALLESKGCSGFLQGALFCSGTPDYEQKVLPLNSLECPVRFLAKPLSISKLRETIQQLTAS